ncbi:MAG: LysR family transcriptional regulator [Bdellovibrionota bacterium]
MFPSLEAFLALCSYGTMTAAASHLNLTQSAISKRITSLETFVGKQLIEKSGNRVQLTAAGLHLKQHLNPLLSQLKELLLEEVTDSSGHLAVAMTESILLSWGAKVLRKVQEDLPGIRFDLYSDRSTLVVESVRSGESLVAICPGEAENTPDLKAERVAAEEMVIVPSHLKPFRLSGRKKLKVFTVHRQHEVSNFIWRGMKRGGRLWGLDFEVERTFNTFAMVTEIAASGWGHGLVTRQLALRMGVPASKLVELRTPGIQVPVSLIGRPTTLMKPIVRTFKERLLHHLPEALRSRELDEA